jgi:hypothetical protein
MLEEVLLTQVSPPPEVGMLKYTVLPAVTLRDVVFEYEPPGVFFWASVT